MPQILINIHHRRKVAEQNRVHGTHVAGLFRKHNSVNNAAAGKRLFDVSCDIRRVFLLAERNPRRGNFEIVDHHLAVFPEQRQIPVGLEKFKAEQDVGLPFGDDR